MNDNTTLNTNSAIFQAEDEQWKYSMLVWSGPAAAILVAIGFFGLAGFLPPPSPTLTGEAMLDIWRENTILKQIGMMFCVWGGLLTIPFAIAIGFALRLTERTPFFSVTQAAFATFGCVFFCLNFYFLFITPFRLDGPVTYTQLLHDIGFIYTFSPVQAFTFQYLLIGIAILADRAEQPVFPRWVGFMNIWIAIFFVPATFVPFFKTGPLAWNGLLSFWIPVAVFFAWFVIMVQSLRKVKPFT